MRFALPSLLFSSILLLQACQSRTLQPADLIIRNATVYTVDSTQQTATAFAINDGKFIAVGSDADITGTYQAIEEIDAGGKLVYPGLIDAHCHFYGYGLNLQQADLIGTGSWQEVVERLVAHRKEHPEQPWLRGRGWDQNDWSHKTFPTKDTLDQLFPDVPVYITRIDGHAALVNQKALDLAGIKPGQKISGGIYELKNGRLTGILIDNSKEKVFKAVPAPSRAEQIAALQQAEKNCFAVGLTTVSDAGLPGPVVRLIDSLQQAGALQMRVYAMLDPSAQNRQQYLKSGPYQTDKLHVCSFKVYADGALGSRGACLLHPYTDMPGQTGFMVTSPEELKQLAQQISNSGFQMNTHCIGDSANRLLLNLYAQVLPQGNDRRWRIEHAQVVHPDDVPKFRSYGIIPSVQPTHCTSDMYWAGERLGPERVKTAYAYKDLRANSKVIAFGSDFPVEYINPLYGFHAAVARQDGKNYPAEGFQMENALSREEALRGMTLYAAFANFEDKEKGSISKGKKADFVILEKDLLKAPKEQLRDVQVLETWVGGKRVFQK